MSTARTNIDVSGSKKGGSVKLYAKNNLVAGKFNADGDLSQGGNIDFTGYNVMVAAADISAKGSNQGGKVRIGGEYLGAKSCQQLSQKEYHGFINRFGNQGDINNAQNTIIDYDVNINISSSFGQGGTAVIWSDEITDFMGSIDANGYLKANNAEITSASNNKEKGGSLKFHQKIFSELLI